MPTKDRIAIKVVLDKYRDAILATNGEAAYKLLDAAKAAGDEAKVEEVREKATPA